MSNDTEAPQAVSTGDDMGNVLIPVLTDEMVEKAACAHYESLEWGGCAGGGWIRQPEGPRNDRMTAMRAALEAVGLPALLEAQLRDALTEEVPA